MEKEKTTSRHWSFARMAEEVLNSGWGRDVESSVNQYGGERADGDSLFMKRNWTQVDHGLLIKLVETAQKIDYALNEQKEVLCLERGWVFLMHADKYILDLHIKHGKAPPRIDGYMDRNRRICFKNISMYGALSWNGCPVGLLAQFDAPMIRRVLTGALPPYTPKLGPLFQQWVKETKG